MEPSYQRAIEGVNALGKASWSQNKDSKNSSHSPTIHDEEWPVNCYDPPMDTAELSSPAVAQDEGESDTFSDPFWQDVDPELIN